MKRRLLLSLLLTVFSLASVQSETVKVAYTPNLGFTQLYVLAKEGWAREAGLDLQLVKYSDASLAVQAFTQGETDILFSGIQPVLIAQSKGLDLTVVSASCVRMCKIYGRGRLLELTKKSSFPAALAQLAKEKKAPVQICTFFRGGPTDIILRYWITQQGPNLKDQIEVINVAGQNQFLQAILTGKYEAVCLFEPLAEIAISKGTGFAQVLSPEEMLPGNPPP